jgi:hypothetical protein
VEILKRARDHQVDDLALVEVRTAGSPPPPWPSMRSLTLHARRTHRAPEAVERDGYRWRDRSVEALE